MQLPKRIEKHVTESKSYKIFSNVLPDEWILRDVTERDYGIDCYVEICRSGQVTGQLLSIQLKGSEDITLREDGQYATYYSLEPSTVNYWYNLPVPVILAHIDVTKKIVYFSNIKKYIREHFAEFKKESLTTIKIPTRHILTSDTTEMVLTYIYLLERDRSNFEHFIADFLLSLEKYIVFLSNNYNRDMFLPIDDDDELIFIMFYNNCKRLANRFDIQWNIRSLQEISEEGQQAFGDHYQYYALQLTEFVKSISPIFKNIVIKLTDFIKGKELDYWRSCKPHLLRYINSNEFKRNMSEIDTLVSLGR